MVVVVAAVLDLDGVVELPVLVAELEVVVFKLLVDNDLVVVLVVAVDVEAFEVEAVTGLLVLTVAVEDEVVEEVGWRSQFPNWHLPYAQKSGPVPHLPAALQQSPHIPVQDLKPWSRPHVPSVL